MFNEENGTKACGTEACGTLFQSPRRDAFFRVACFAGAKGGGL